MRDSLSYFDFNAEMRNYIYQGYTNAHDYTKAYMALQRFIYIAEIHKKDMEKNYFDYYVWVTIFNVRVGRINIDDAIKILKLALDQVKSLPLSEREPLYENFDNLVRDYLFQIHSFYPKNKKTAVILEEKKLYSFLLNYYDSISRPSHRLVDPSRFDSDYTSASDKYDLEHNLAENKEILELYNPFFIEDMLIRDYRLFQALDIKPTPSSTIKNSSLSLEQDHAEDKSPDKSPFSPYIHYNPLLSPVINLEAKSQHETSKFVESKSHPDNLEDKKTSLSSSSSESADYVSSRIDLKTTPIDKDKKINISTSVIKNSSLKIEPIISAFLEIDHYAALPPTEDKSPDKSPLEAKSQHDTSTFVESKSHPDNLEDKKTSLSALSSDSADKVSSLIDLRTIPIDKDKKINISTSAIKNSSLKIEPIISAFLEIDYYAPLPPTEDKSPDKSPFSPYIHYSPLLSPVINLEAKFQLNTSTFSESEDKVSSLIDLRTIPIDKDKKINISTNTKLTKVFEESVSRNNSPHNYFLEDPSIKYESELVSYNNEKKHVAFTVINLEFKKKMHKSLFSLYQLEAHNPQTNEFIPFVKWFENYIKSDSTSIAEIKMKYDQGKYDLMLLKSDKEREPYEAKFIDGLLYVKANHPHFENKQIIGKPKLDEWILADIDASRFIFNLKDDKLYIAKPVAGQFHHTSFFGDKPENVCAGELVLDHGKIARLSNLTGHYQTSASSFNTQVLPFLIKNKATNHLVSMNIIKKTLTIADTKLYILPYSKSDISLSQMAPNSIILLPDKNQVENKNSMTVFFISDGKIASAKKIECSAKELDFLNKLKNPQTQQVNQSYNEKYFNQFIIDISKRVNYFPNSMQVVATNTLTYSKAETQKHINKIKITQTLRTIPQKLISPSAFKQKTKSELKEPVNDASVPVPDKKLGSSR